jgi:hypothetical protein
VGIATVIMGVVVLVVSNLSGAEHGFGLLVRVAASVIAGGVVYAGAISLLGGREHRNGRRHRPPPPRPRNSG